MDNDDMDIDKYLEFVAAKIREAISKNDLMEVVRLLRVCSEALLDKVADIEKQV